MDEVTLERFLSKIRILDSGCWEWMGTISEDGYGVFAINGANRLAHRLIWEHFVGRIPTGLTMDHLCHTRHSTCPGGKDDPHRRCVCWVGHLEPVTPEENNRRARNRLTHCVNAHEFTPETTYWTPDGYRECRICRDDRSKAWMAVHNPGVRHGTEELCPQGHPYEGDNLLITVIGGRACRECKRAWSRAYARVKRTVERGYVPLGFESMICPAGHDLSDGGVFAYKDMLVCLPCVSPDSPAFVGSRKGGAAREAA